MTAETPTLMTIFGHQDDETFSAGGILAKYADIGRSFALSVTSDPLRDDEFETACSILGVTPLLLNYKRINPAIEVEIRDQIMEIIRKYEPNQIITHLEYDYHYEHRLVRSIVEEAVEWVSHTTSGNKSILINGLWAAETTVLISNPHIFVDISDYNEKRIKAIKCYESQSHKGGQGFYSRFHNTRTKLRGIQAATEHAEAFVQIPISQVGSFKSIKVIDVLPG